MNKSISIIVPVYNAMHTLERCVDSLINQTNIDALELIFVNDNSSDNSLQILEDYLNRFDKTQVNFKVINHSVNMGAAVARNTGIDHASGDYIGWVDADDWVDSGMFEAMYNEAIKKDLDIVWVDFYNNYGEKEDLINQQYEGSNRECIKKMLNGQLSGVMWNKLTKKTLYSENKVRFPDGLDMCEDLRVNVQLFYYADKVAYLKGAFYHHFKMKIDSITKESVLKSQINYDWIENAKGIIEFTRDKGIDLSEVEVALIQLAPKMNLLVRGNKLSTFKAWRGIFPEANRFVWETKMPFHYKVIACCADKEIWSVVNLWILIKYRFFNKK